MTNTSTLRNVLAGIGHPRVLVVGDLILDRYTFGNAERVSPEAPVLVLRVDDKEVRLGGAASVAMLLRGLEAKVSLAGIVGDDPEGRLLRSLLSDEQIDCNFVHVDASRPTTMKERIIGRAANRHAHQIVRIDHESRAPIHNELENKIFDGLLGKLSSFQIVLIADYAKGVCTPKLLRHIIDTAREHHLPVIVDPARIADYSRYAGTTLLKPNRTEAELASGQQIASPTEALAIGGQLCHDHKLAAAMITLDREGMALVQNDGSTELFPAEPREIYDITGAGDMVLAALGLCLAAGLSLPDAAQIANVAAGLEIERLGVSPVTRGELAHTLDHTLPALRGVGQGKVCDGAPISKPASKLISLQQAVTLAAEYRSQGKSLVFTNGCFDLLHIGHVTMLEQAATLGDILIVGVNSDASVRRLKGPDRPVILEQHRAQILASLGCVDHVVIFDDPTPHNLLATIRPDILAKGGTTPEIVGREVVEPYGGRAVRLGELPGISTTALLASLPHSATETYCRPLSQNRTSG